MKLKLSRAGTLIFGIATFTLRSHRRLQIIRSNEGSFKQNVAGASGATEHKITISPTSGRRFLAMVTSFTGSQERRIKFFRAWHGVWPELAIVTEYSYLNHYDLQGYAILSANVIGMYRALVFAEESHQEFDYFLVFEDDAIPFQNTSWPTKSAGNSNLNNDLDHMLDEIEAEDGGALYLGCHHAKSVDRDRLIDNNGEINASVALLNHAWGAYAWIISRKHLRALQQKYAGVLQGKKGRDGTTDKDNHIFFLERRVKEFISVPLLVDHQSFGESLTWKRAKRREWEGRRDWWNCFETCAQQNDQKHFV